jgi:hypothetical protein
MKLKTSLPVIWLENIDFEKSGFVRTQQTTQTDPDFGWSGRWWRLKRSSTNWSLFSKWFGTGLGVILVLKRLDFSSTFVSRLLCVSSVILSSINWSRLQVRILVSGIETRFRFRNPDSYPYPKQLCVQDLNLKIEN